ncbi:hypothetical protein L2E82_01212 [Cichorium intybus]|uniref:Uncharacterized protein n=1 Tax=Cichorium intybus TaxID=13427 RepID=A0ACB9GY90_CICIN|nr:hypothetical protein L2E82_01212 [Cichorium intybus]
MYEVPVRFNAQSRSPNAHIPNPPHDLPVADILLIQNQLIQQCSGVVERESAFVDAGFCQQQLWKRNFEKLGLLVPDMAAVKGEDPVMIE